MKQPYENKNQPKMMIEETRMKRSRDDKCIRFQMAFIMNLCALNLAVYCACKRDKNGNERRSPRVLKAHTHPNTTKRIQRCTMRAVNITIYENTGKRTKLFCVVSCFSLLSFYVLFYINKRETYNYTFSIGNACALMYACMLRYLCVYVVHP